MIIIIWAWNVCLHIFLKFLCRCNMEPQFYRVPKVFECVSTSYFTLHTPNFSFLKVSHFFEILNNWGVWWLLASRLPATHVGTPSPEVELSALISCDICSSLFNFMMTSSNGNIFRVTCHLCGESPFTGKCFAQRPVTRSFDVFFDLRLNERLSKQSWGWWFETPPHPLWCHSNIELFLWMHMHEVVWFLYIVISYWITDSIKNYDMLNKGFSSNMNNFITSTIYFLLNVDPDIVQYDIIKKVWKIRYEWKHDFYSRISLPAIAYAGSYVTIPIKFMAWQINVIATQRTVLWAQVNWALIDSKSTDRRWNNELFLHAQGLYHSCLKLLVSMVRSMSSGFLSIGFDILYCQIYT